MSRKLAREVAMKLAFARLLGGENDYEVILEQMGVDEPPRPEDVSFSDCLLEGMAKCEAEVDEWIEKHAIGWSLDRMPKVDLCILRIALYEMLYREDISHSVSINEAVELSKRFGGDKSPAFINGLLGKASQEMTKC
ncbi:transcription antitermination factor NusB [Eubacteriales bacterium OttesenSCG-928-K08]|nr:transcription antitermination factor NusB [Eubacteriales bacterium OttesenSCG-928-K08]